MRISTIAFSLFCLAATPLAAQTPAFGDDSSAWSNDGECDDPRFEGPGMTQTPLLDEDIKHDATDCAAAFAAGTIALVGSGMATSAAASEPGQIIDGIAFGDDSGDWTNDNECDDRRFFGRGMAASVSWENVGKDATDCIAAYQSGSVKRWDFSAAMAATQCDTIDFGDDSGPYPGDSECDDQRFEGPAVALSLSADNIGKDASDCSRHCTFGTLALRDYE